MSVCIMVDVFFGVFCCSGVLVFCGMGVFWLKRRWCGWGWEWLLGVSSLYVIVFFFGVDMLDDVVGKVVNIIVSCFGYFGEFFCFGLVFKCVIWEIDVWFVNVGFD